MRTEMIKFYLAYSTPTAEELEFISARLSVAKMRRYKNIPNDRWSVLKTNIISELYYKYPDATFCGKATTWDDCFLYEEFDQTLYLYYNIGKDTHCLTRKIR